MSENNQKIKKVTINNQEIPLSILSEEFIKKQEDGTKCEAYSFWLDDFKVGVEYEPKLLERPDGSLISEPEEGANVILITSYHQPEKLFYGKYLHQDLKKGYIFLEKDKHLAEKKAKMLTKQLEIQYEIDRLNAEKNSEIKKKVIFVVNMYDQVVFGNDLYIYSQNIKMSEKTAETILKKYTQDELKQYLGIII